MGSTPSPWQRALYPPLTILAWLVVVVVAGWLLGHVTKAIVMIALSAILAFALTPLAVLLARWAPRPVALGLAYLVGIGLLFGLGAFIVATAAGQVTTLFANLPDYTRQVQELQPRAEALLAPLGVTPEQIQGVREQAIGSVQSAAAGLARESLARITAIAGTIVDVILVLILSIYLAANGPRIAGWLRRESPGPQRARINLLIAIVVRVVGGYIRGTLLLAILIGVLVGVGLTLLGIPYAVLLGVLAFFMEFIPVLGVFVSGFAAVAVALFHGWPRALLVLGYFVLVHIVEGDVVGPRIMGKAVGIHPATGLVALVAGTELFGVWGALFAAPVAGLLQAIGTAVWLELRGGDPQTVVGAVADSAEAEVQDRLGVGPRRP